MRKHRRIIFKQKSFRTRSNAKTTAAFLEKLFNATCNKAFSMENYANVLERRPLFKEFLTRDLKVAMWHSIEVAKEIITLSSLSSYRFCAVIKHETKIKPSIYESNVFPDKIFTLTRICVSTKIISYVMLVLSNK